MINKIGDIDGIPIYEDSYMEDDNVLRGRKQGSDTIFLVANPKTTSIIYKQFIIKSRKDKLEYLNNLVK